MPLSKDFLKGFVTFLDTASAEQLRARREALERLMEDITDRAFRSDLRRLRRMIDEELLIRVQTHDPR